MIDSQPSPRTQDDEYRHKTYTPPPPGDRLRGGVAIPGLSSSGCTCHEVEAMVVAVLRGDDPPDCPVHTAAAERRQRAEHRNELHAIRGDELRAQLEAGAAAVDAEKRRTGLANLRAVDPLVASLTEITGADIPLTAPPSAFPALSAYNPGPEAA